MGYTKAEFQKICAECVHSTPIHLAVLLATLRTSFSNSQLAMIFWVSKSTITNYIAIARDDLYQFLVPQYLNTTSRDTLSSHNTQIARDLFQMSRDAVWVLWDGTYRIMGKSMNFEAQRKLFSVQKKLPLYKIMAGVCPDGYVAFALGPS